uniref:(northern house mosquito) hypothetical protein n=1 Tax=Culex pipiens TaxID=7175 RepID=A0A8D8BK93_CULPI
MFRARFRQANTFVVLPQRRLVLLGQVQPVCLSAHLGRLPRALSARSGRRRRRKLLHQSALLDGARVLGQAGVRRQIWAQSVQLALQPHHWPLVHQLLGGGRHRFRSVDHRETVRV